MRQRVLSWEDWLNALSPLNRLGAAAIRRAVLPMLALACVAPPVVVLHAQAPATASAPATRALGTVSSITESGITVKTDAGASVAVTFATTVRVQQLAPGSTDLKTAEPASAGSIAVGDRVLVSGSAAGDGLTASRVILMKSAAIAERNQTSQSDWARRGTGGIVTAVASGTGAISVSAGARKLTVDTTATTKFRRYAPGSVKFEDAKPGTLAEIHVGDQLRAKGERSADGMTVTAEEVVSGSFRNLSGTIVSVNPTAGSLVIKDLATKKDETVLVGAESDLRALPPELAARFAPGRAARTADSAGAPANITRAAGGSRPGGASTGAATGEVQGGAPRGAGAGGRAGSDLSMMIPRLPKTTMADLKPGEALMVVASANTGGQYTAITALTGVEPLLTGAGGSQITLPPWSSAGGESAGAGPE